MNSITLLLAYSRIEFKDIQRDVWKYESVVGCSNQLPSIQEEGIKV